MQTEVVELFSLWGENRYITVLFDSDFNTESYKNFISYQKLKEEIKEIENRLYIALEQYFFTKHNYSWSKEIFNHINDYIQLKYIELVPDPKDTHHEVRFYFQENFIYNYYIMLQMVDGDVVTVKRDCFKNLRGEKE